MRWTHIRVLPDTVRKTVSGRISCERNESSGAPGSKCITKGTMSNNNTLDPSNFVMSLVSEAFRSIDLLQHVPEAVLRRLTRHFHRIPITVGTVLFNVGDASDSFYVIESGEYAIEAAMHRSGCNCRAQERYLQLVDSDGFGELALLSDRPRTGTAW
ncbi:hypothetical protein EMIHUDRAFT_208090 [Emiliania huxleyi CCMP1516]|uniref:Cyclic nucleotide-binding domain-containing protein n=2 Tax=Emiliania huxleyi TaxID=2903 RepID=A0A0D3JBW7_EMIH1|nr:hypothetical protein EMIHUDRAFT_208090 [Emiliania huxleyi CCMP1516]EOD21002.1 hypothetical protein EMIHUDRAFT_208090 [Emiliania huxleyi CCMP1516]|eukprot:XP_005773431.1 hypothetical protein EMIHUDRAFT_208090 [Emiliania huxleyi CCMP1516]